ncbi:hypothetical protein ACQ4LE_011062 [Meloidogyne hapla]
MNALRFEGRVVLVTGGGRGLGRSYALEFAKRGAKVIGGDRHGQSSSNSAADEVVKEIKACGGQAVANYDSVDRGESIVQTAIKNYGRIDVVINNAGILRDTSFAKMSELDWDLVIKVHLKGAFSVTKAAWPYMRENNYGRLVFVSSNSGIYGSFGQGNYAAAKMALIGLSKTLALEGQKYNIISNALVPTAGSRMTETIMPDDLVEALKPEFVVPLCVYLGHESCKSTGRIFEGGAGWYGTVEFYRSEGLVIANASAENVADNWEKICNMKGAKNFESSNDVMAELVNVLQEKNTSKL